MRPSLARAYALLLLLSACNPGAEVTTPDGDAATTPDSGSSPGAPRALRPTAHAPPALRAEPSAPPPVSGGTLLVTRDGAWAVAADPDRDLVWVVNVRATTLHGALVLERGDEPGRVAEDAVGRVHVALRSAGDVVTIDPDVPTVLDRRAVCSAPRGIAYDEQLDALHVACAGGELVSLPPDGGPPTRAVDLGPDLRDVVPVGDALFVSRFRSAEIIRVGADGTVAARFELPDAASGDSEIVRTPSVAWRMRRAPAGDGVIVLHQRAASSVVRAETDGYAIGVCGSGAVEPALTVLSSTGAVVASWTLEDAPLAVDFGARPDTGEIAVVSGRAGAVSAVWVYGPDELLRNAPVGACARPAFSPGVVRGPQRTSVEWTPDGALVVLGRQPATLAVGRTELPLPGTDRDEPGHRLFHTAPVGSGVACASCHPEGRDDSHVWRFEATGERRTQSLVGGILGTEPFHWNGDVPNIETVIETTFDRRMFGGYVWPSQVHALARWLDAQPVIPHARPDPAATARGERLFRSDEIGCATCHSGEELTDNRNHDVGTGGPFQVPSLVGVADRAPFLHDGCARTLDEALDACGAAPGVHGDTSGLEATERADLVAYLRAL